MALSTFQPSHPSRSTATLEARGATHPGKRREHNEDVHGLYPEERLFVVADGMGGAAGGATAARLTVDALSTFFTSHRHAPQDRWPHPVDLSQPVGANLLRVGMLVANGKVRHGQRTLGFDKMGSTAAALAVGQARVAIAHVGDVRVYRLRDGAFDRLTRDHTLREQVKDMQPDITEAELLEIPQRDLVTKVVGMGDELEPSVGVHELRAGDLFLLCCDGLWGPVGEQTIADVLVGTPDLTDACNALVEAALDAGGPDNVTAVLVRVGAA